VIVWDKNGQNIHMNKSVTEITGYTVEDVPSSDNWAGLVYPDPVYRNQVKILWQQQTKKGEPSEYRVTCKDGTVKDIEFRATFLPDGSVIDTLTDVTDRNQNEKALAEIRKIRVQAKKMESLGLLAGGVAHDLNNILSGIVSYPDLILLELPKEGKITKAIQLIRDSGIKATAIVQDLLTVARGVAISKEALNLNTIIEEYMQSPDFECVQKVHDKVRVKVSLADDLHNIMGSRVHLRKILMNLVSNGCEAIEGAGEVCISTENISIDGPLYGHKEVEPGDYVVLRVTDQGKGISSMDLERIFEPFYSKKVMGRSGTGLGLTVVWNVVQDHNGSINVASSEEGTQFAIYLPATRHVVLESEDVFDMDLYNGKGETILIVDDISSQRQITAGILEKLGYRTAEAANGEEAVEFVRRQRVDLILLDMIMDPGINGRETFSRIRQIVPDQKAIIVSGFAETKDVKETLRLGAGRFLKKPFMMHELATSVRDVLDG
jgi:PAS domain S-box-containing protein